MSWLFSLKSIFPEFPWVQVADDWLALAHQKSIEQQLEERGIKKVRFWYNIAAGYITVKEFGILLVVDRDLIDHFLMGYNKAEELLFTFGHEIGHTFHCDLTQAPPVNIGPEKVFCSPFEELAKEGDALCQSVERFCDEFAARWTHMNSLSKFRQFFSKNKNTDLLSVKHDIYNRAE
ncbi:MAG: hypothetical protein A3C58_01595 [Candidatus Staskawiczbacteria bacterium RIFCSPHIGHO2_02_FULL_34_10]|uniref:IrrE N-terminal-like domain-containing protein n=2 Tax=Candidatus Staskawicziibacteriota TaxID=1817916 RepID=A0A1G2HLE1_9BACT|nr:MAG: hypothetical protein A2639_02125 [Candidatus Staskawiczbacteria bacterium RIFCSPHIGHO2_01_FULL_34_27]OGZ66226.1 MAG: hypothetical protein A3C58_01595 [Candidatus Staskawiczbacteria bacterium RIFCSPHIGHO2_02_FULL_34_10]